MIARGVRFSGLHPVVRTPSCEIEESAALKALTSSASLSGLHFCAFVGLVTADHATCRRSEQSMMSGEMVPTTAPLMQPLASADVAVAKIIKTAAHPMSVFILASSRELIRYGGNVGARAKRCLHL